MIDWSLAANRTALVRARGRGGAGPAPGAERYLRRAAGPEEAGAGGSSRLAASVRASLREVAGQRGEKLRARPDRGAERSGGAGAQSQPAEALSSPRHALQPLSMLRTLPGPSPRR